MSPAAETALLDRVLAALALDLPDDGGAGDGTLASAVSAFSIPSDATDWKR